MGRRKTLVEKRLVQDAVYWPSPTPDGYGRSTFGTPVDIKVFWVWEQEMFLDIDGDEILSKAVVYIDRDLTRGNDGWGFLWLGKTTDSGYNADPTSLVDAGKIRSFVKHPDIRARHFDRKVHLI